MKSLMASDKAYTAFDREWFLLSDPHVCELPRASSCNPETSVMYPAAGFSAITYMDVIMRWRSGTAISRSIRGGIEAQLAIGSNKCI